MVGLLALRVGSSYNRVCRRTKLHNSSCIEISDRSIRGWVCECIPSRVKRVVVIVSDIEMLTVAVSSLASSTSSPSGIGTMNGHSALL